MRKWVNTTRVYVTPKRTTKYWDPKTRLAVDFPKGHWFLLDFVRYGFKPPSGYAERNDFLKGKGANEPFDKKKPNIRGSFAIKHLTGNRLKRSDKAMKAKRRAEHQASVQRKRTGGPRRLRRQRYYDRHPKARRPEGLSHA